MELAISIVNWNTKDLLKNCLNSILQNYKRCDFEIIVVDNNSSDGSFEMLEEYFPQVKKIKNKENIGFGKANNQIMAISKGEYILILNPDIIIKTGAIEKMVDFLKKNRDAAAVGAKLLNPDGSIQRGFYRRFPSLMQIILFETFLYKIFIYWTYIWDRYLEYKNVEHLHEIDQIPGACILVRKKVIEEIGGFDEDFFVWYEDVDLCYRIKKAGWKLYYLPEAEIVHIGGQSFLNLNSGKRIILFYNSLMKFLSKHYSKSDYFLARLIITFNFIILNIIQILLYPFARNRRQKWKDHISARFNWITNA